MTKYSPLAVLLAGLALVLTPGLAAAQGSSGTGSLTPVAFPRWDAGASAGFLALTASETRLDWGGWNQTFLFRGEAGHYWTTHVKTEIAVIGSTPRTDYETERFAIPGVASPGYASTEVTRRTVSLAPAVTWQFRENTFMHPYVSGGVDVGVRRDHRERIGTTYRIGNVSYPVPAVDDARTVVQARPFVAGGFKSYLSRSIYVRTEGRVAFAQDGVRQVALTAGIGIDF